jgi:PAS domain S-box-containing protein
MPTSGSTRAPGAPDTVHELSLDNRMYQKDRQLIRKIAIGILLFWTGVIAFSLYSNVSLHYDQAHRHAKQKAVDHFNKEMAFRLWATGKGGFYLPVGDRTAPVHYLDFLEERDVFTEDDRILTLYDPVTALREIVATHGDIYGLAGRLVGENPINPEATPDPWEQLALRAFQGGVREVFEIAEKDGEAFVRIMRPMPTRPGCLKCHGHLGHKAGEIRAGVSMAVPLREFTDDARSAAVTSAFSHGGLWLLGLLGIALTLQRIYRQMRERHVHMAEMELSEKVFAEGMQGILITDANGIILRVNQMFTSITGYPAEQVIGRRPSLLKSHHHHESFYQELWQSLLQRKFWVGEIWNRHQDGHYYLLKETISTVTDEHGDTRFYISMFQDITEEHQSRERIFQLAHYDTLTRLPNRELFLDRARQALEKARRYGKPLAVLFLDLDNFKREHYPIVPPRSAKSALMYFSST